MVIKWVTQTYNSVVFSIGGLQPKRAFLYKPFLNWIFPCYLYCSIKHCGKVWKTKGFITITNTKKILYHHSRGSASSHRRQRINCPFVIPWREPTLYGRKAERGFGNNFFPVFSLFFNPKKWKKEFDVFCCPIIKDSQSEKDSTAR